MDGGHLRPGHAVALDERQRLLGVEVVHEHERVAPSEGHVRVPARSGVVEHRGDEVDLAGIGDQSEATVERRLRSLERGGGALGLLLAVRRADDRLRSPGGARRVVAQRREGGADLVGRGGRPTPRPATPRSRPRGRSSPAGPRTRRGCRARRSPTARARRRRGTRPRRAWTRNDTGMTVAPRRPAPTTISKNSIELRSATAMRSPFVDASCREGARGLVATRIELLPADDPVAEHERRDVGPVDHVGLDRIHGRDVTVARTPPSCVPRHCGSQRRWCSR